MDSISPPPPVMKSVTLRLFVPLSVFTKSTVCPRSSDPFHVANYYIKWVTTSWTYCIKLVNTFNTIFQWSGGSQGHPGDEREADHPQPCLGGELQIVSYVQHLCRFILISYCLTYWSYFFGCYLIT